MKRAVIWFIAIYFGVAGAALALDISGWQGTRWGMTEPEVRATLESSGVTLARPTNYPNYRAGFLATFTIDSKDCRAMFRYQNAGLDRVDVFCTGGVDFYVRLMGLLSEKYGPGSAKGLHQHEWRLPSTVIEIDKRLLSMGVLYEVEIHYYPASQYKDEKGKL